MATISIHHEDLSQAGRKQRHENNIVRFRKIAQEEFEEFDGEVIFDYITRYEQFELQKYPESMDEELINAKIEKMNRSFPGIFI